MSESDTVTSEAEVSAPYRAQARHRIKLHNETAKLVSAHYDRAASNLQVAGFIAPVASWLFGIGSGVLASLSGFGYFALIAACFLVFSFILHARAKDYLNQMTEEE